jgi:hypothetical protein
MIKKYKILLFILLIAAAAYFILSLSSLLKLVEVLGYRIPQKNIQLDYIKGVIWAVFLGLTILIWPVRSGDKKALLWIWAVKCFVMLFLMLFFEYRYQTDSFGYFSGARYDIRIWKDMHLGGSSFPVVFISWLHQHCFFDSFHAAKVSFGMIGLAAIYIFYRAAVIFQGQENLKLLYLFSFFPSILFWSSTLGKEPIMLLSMAVYFYGIIRWLRRKELIYLMVMLLGILVATYLRVWLGIILSLPVLLISIVLIARDFPINAAPIFILLPALLFYSMQVSRSWDLKSIADLPRIVNHKFTYFSQGNSMLGEERLTRLSKMVNTLPKIEELKGEKDMIPQHITYDDSLGYLVMRYNNFMDMLFSLPKGMFTVLFRPLPGEVNNIFGLLAGLEGAFLLILFALAIKRTRWRELLLDPVCMWAILLIAIWSAAYGFVAYNLGTVCRYRMQILPIFLGLLIYMAHGKTKPTANDIKNEV